MKIYKICMCVASKTTPCILVRRRSIQLSIFVSLILLTLLADVIILTCFPSHSKVSFFGIWMLRSANGKWFGASRQFDNLVDAAADDDDAKSLQRLVTFDPLSLCDGRRLGNQLFTVAALVYVAKLTNRTIVLPSREALKCLDAFEEHFVPDIDARSTHVAETSRAPIVISRSSRFNSSSVQLCPCFRFNETLAMAYDNLVERLPSDIQLASKRTLVLIGYFQSWRYVDPIAESIRRVFTFTPEVRRSAAAYIAQVTLDQVRASVDRLVRVGVHARRGDMVNVKTGYEPPSGEFYRRALTYFIERYHRVQFIVCSDDINWATKNIIVPSVNVTGHSDETRQLVSLEFCPQGKSAGHDLAVLSMCDHAIVSAGTFGWWAAWLSNGTTVYFKNWPRRGTKLEAMFVRSDYYPPHWIPMGE